MVSCLRPQKAECQDGAALPDTITSSWGCLAEEAPSAAVLWDDRQRSQGAEGEQSP